MSKTAIFPGSFAPFTVGHQSIVDRALPLFDKIIIAIGINGEKNQYFSIEERMNWIESVYKNNPKIEIYYSNDNHFNIKGYSLVSKSISKKLKQFYNIN